MFMRALCVLTGLVLAIGSFHPTLAQMETATLSGRVTDQQGAVVPGAEVGVTNIDTNILTSTVTNVAGIYVFPSLRPGRYRIIVRKEGFKEIVKTDVTLRVQDTFAVNFGLEVGSVTQSITVPGSTPLINTESGAVGTLVNRDFMENLPLNGRNFNTLIGLTPGAILARGSSEDAGQFSINGQRSTANYFMVDGVSANLSISAGTALNQVGSVPGWNALGGTSNLASVDAVEEFRIQTSTYAPEFGHGSGGQVSIVTRSGTNAFHGSVFEYFRNDVLNAADWFINRNGLRKPAERFNNFGGTLGGPVIRNRTFFFFSYEGVRLRQPLNKTTLVPSLDLRAQAPAQIQPYLNGFPQPNGQVFANGMAEFSAAYSDPSTLNATSIRVDHYLSSKLTLFGRYNHAPSKTLTRGLFGQALSLVAPTRFNTKTVTVGATLQVTSSISSELRFNHSRYNASQYSDLDDFGGAVPPPDSVLQAPLAPNGDPERRNSGRFFVTIGGFTGITSGRNSDNLNRQFNIIDNWSWIVGSHTLKFGFDYRRLSPRYAPLGFSLAGIFATDSNILSGIANSFSQVGGGPVLYPIFQNFSLFGQDTWKVGPRLTLTYGLRWDVAPPPGEAKGNDAISIIGLEDPLTMRPAPVGTPLYKTRYSNFGPRVGAAFQLFQRPGWQTVLRGGFGVFHDLGSGLVSTAFTYGSFYLTRKSGTNVPWPLDPVTAQPAPFSLDPPFTFRSSVDPNLKTPYTLQWNLSVEQQVGTHQIVSASYVAAVGRKLFRFEAIQAPDFIGGLLVTRNNATSDYHSLQLHFQRRLSKGLQALASYTWSHSLDTASSDAARLVPIEKIDIRQERGPSDFDIRHTFSAAASYDIPTPKVTEALRLVLKDWAMDTIMFFRTATPVNIFTNQDVFGVQSYGAQQSRPDVVPGVPLYIKDGSLPGGRRINSAAFTIPVGRQGNLSRNALRGFNAAQVDYSIRRDFSFTERVQLQFRADFFNIFNHPNFGDQGASGTNRMGHPLFGQSTLTLASSLGSGGFLGGLNPTYQIGGPRSVQLGLKVKF